MNFDHKKIVYVMMSGGVDSSVAAADLVEQGYDVRGVFMKCWSQIQLAKLGLDPADYACAWEEDEQDAQVVAKKLGIPFETWDLQDEYMNNVVQYMVDEYRHGKTPNPDVMCNSTIKFGVFYERAIAAGANYVATGHYARSVIDTDGLRSLHRGLDSNKDQSYFLWRMSYTALQHSLFPIGEYASKVLVRERASKHGLITATKPDSQGICFIGDTPLRDILLKVLGTKPGNIVDSNGNKLGTHPGAFLYTIGQRHGLGLSGGPWLVQSIDIESNTVRVIHESEIGLVMGTELVAIEPQWLVAQSLDILQSNVQLSAQVRYRQEAIGCKIVVDSDHLVISFSEPVKAIAKGQSVVIYNNDLILGGAIIQ